MFKIVRYTLDQGSPPQVPERLTLVDTDSYQDARILAVRVLGIESERDVVLTEFVGAVPRGTRVLHPKMTFEEMYGLVPGGMVSAL